MILIFLFVLLNFNAIEVLCGSQSSLTFVIDDTGSMGDDIEEVKASVNAIFDAIVNSEQSPIEDFVLATFNDPETQLRTVTRDTKVFKKALADISVHGGGDCPEYCMSGIIVGIENSRPGSTIYVFTDASAKDTFKYEEAKYLALKKQIQVVFVLSGTCPAGFVVHYIPEIYENLARDTLGEVFLLKKQEIHKILKYVTENVKGRRTLLAYSDFSDGSYSLHFIIDKHLTDVMVSVTGKNITLNITNLDGVEANTESIVKLENISILKLLKPKPGEYIAEVSGESELHVHVSGMTDIEFQQGFSEFEPWSMEETTTMPLPDAKSYISVKMNDDTIDLKVVQLLDMDDNLIKEVPLVPANKQEKFYTTTLEDIPGTAFKLAVIGYDPDSDKDIRRIGPPVESQAQPKKVQNRAPKVSILGPVTQEVKWQRPFELKCKVSGYPQPNISWVDKSTGKELPFIYVYNVELPFDFMSIVDINGVVKNTSYECRATNALGSDSATADIILTKIPYFNIMKKLKDMTIYYNEEAILNCEADNYPAPANITWYKDMNVLSESDNIEFIDDNFLVKIKKMRPSDAGSYVCELKNDIARYLYSAELTLTGKEPPRE